MFVIASRLSGTQYQFRNVGFGLDLSFSIPIAFDFHYRRLHRVEFPRKRLSLWSNAHLMAFIFLMAVRGYMRADYLKVERNRTSIFQNGSFTTKIEKCTFMKIIRLNTVKSCIPIEARKLKENILVECKKEL